MLYTYVCVCKTCSLRRSKHGGGGQCTYMIYEPSSPSNGFISIIHGGIGCGRVLKKARVD